MIDRNELWAQAEELAELLIRCPEIQAYREAEARMNANPQAVSMIRKLRELQEEIADFQARRVPEAYYRHLVAESESLLAKLEKIPEVKAFQEAQTAVNDLLQEVTQRIAAVLTSGGTHDGPDGSACKADWRPPR
jgi:cell fate (sporulation/competence/biofilm development) regulator YmcA (YheA/YmcA/DUF963 family)